MDSATISQHCVPSLLVEGVLQAALASLGILGNFTSIFILSRRELQSPFNQVTGSYLHCSLEAFPEKSR